MEAVIRIGSCCSNWFKENSGIQWQEIPLLTLMMLALHEVFEIFVALDDDVIFDGALILDMLRYSCLERKK